MNTDQIMSAIFLIAVLILILPSFLSTNYKLKEFLRKKDELPKLKLQYKIINEKLTKLNDRKEKIIFLVSGKSNLETLFERIEYIGNKNKIEITKINKISK